MTDQPTDGLDAYLLPYREKAPNAAVSIAWRHGAQAWSEVITLGTPISTHSCFPIWSLTKTFIAVATLRLATFGKLSLEDRIARWLPSIPHAEAITVHQCLQHTSGWPDYGCLPGYHAAVQRGDPPWTSDEFLKNAHAEKLAFPPGSGWLYSNIGYMVLRKALECICDLPFHDVIREQISKPLDLSHTRVMEGASDFLHLTPGYSYKWSGHQDPVEQGNALDIRPLYDPNWVATGLIASTATDITNFYHRLFNGTFLSAGLIALLTSIVPTGTQSHGLITPSYSLGLMVDPDWPHGPIFGHDGEGPGYAASAWHLNCLGEQGVTATVLSNTENCLETRTMALEIVKRLR